MYFYFFDPEHRSENTKGKIHFSLQILETKTKNTKMKRDIDLLLLLCLRRVFPNFLSSYVYNEIRECIRNEIRPGLITGIEYPQKPQTLSYYIRDKLAKLLASELFEETVVKDDILKLSTYNSLTFFDKIETGSTASSLALRKVICSECCSEDYIGNCVECKMWSKICVRDRVEQHGILKCLDRDFISFHYNSVFEWNEKIYQKTPFRSHSICRRADFIYDIDIWDPDHDCDEVEIVFGVYRYPFTWKESEKKWELNLFRPPYSPHMMVASNYNVLEVAIYRNNNKSEITLNLTMKYGWMSSEKRKKLKDSPFKTLCGEKYLKYEDGIVTLL